ncbi:hypothetical protein ZWY2020_003868 [Hordeum vulgare]|nr:hypothetical protein ZWY2020_003868 [Hordeum vulgare]
MSEPDPVPPLEKAISEPVGKLITADLASFEHDGPARIDILCPAPAEIDGLSLVFYFGSKGRRLTFELESPAPAVQLDPAPSEPVPGDGGLDEEGGSSEEGSSSDEGDELVGAPPEPSGGRRNPAPSAAGQTGLAGGSTVGTLAPVVAVGTETTLPASPIPVVGAKEEVSVGMEVCPASSPCSPGVVCYSRSPGSPLPQPWGPRIRSLRWPPLGCKLSPSVPFAMTEGASPAVAACQSTRISQSRTLQDGRVPTIPELAARDLFPGTPSLLPPSSSGSRFSVLSSELMPLLAVVAADSGIVFRGEKGPPLEHISAICAKERLEGALGEARCLVAGSNPSNPPHPRCTSDLVIERPGKAAHPRQRLKLVPARP